ncbi:MAG TPA: hypothetical protein VLA21_11860 [Candidatus Limnocylindria bacterium]|nr:hypothetical protein [Candidatus Limnocylindria bacterium]
MKTLLIIVGVVLIAGAVYGFINAGSGGEGINVSLEGVGSLQINTTSNFWDDAVDFMTDNRIVMLIVGAVSLIAGLAIPVDTRRRA